MTDQTDGWVRSLAQAAEFASAGNTDDAVARARSVYLETLRALDSPSCADDAVREVVVRFRERAMTELARLRELRVAGRMRTAARSDAYYERERAATRASSAEQARRRGGAG